MNRELNRTTPPAIRTLDRLHLPAVERATLPNGVAFVKLNHGLQTVCRLSIVWPVGMADVESPEALRLLRPMLLEGTALHPGGEIVETFEFNGAWVKVEAARHMTSITIHFLNKTASIVLPYIAELIAMPNFPAESFLKIREKEASACEMSRRKVSTMASEVIDGLAFGKGHPLARCVLPDAIRNVGRELLPVLQKQLMCSTVPTVYLAGRFDEAVTRAVESTVGQLDFSAGAGGISRRVEQPMFDREGAKEVWRDEHALQTAVKMAIPTISRSHPDYEALRFAVFVLGGYFGSRLMSNIREEKGYTYGITSSLSSLPEGAFVTISCQTDNRYVGAVLDEIEHEITQLASDGVSTAELDVVKNTAMSGLASMLDSPFSIMDFYQMSDLYGFRPEAYERQVIELAELTSQRIKDCICKYLGKAPRLIALAGNPA